MEKWEFIFFPDYGAPSSRVGTVDWIEGTSVIVPDKIIHVIEAITNTSYMYYWRRCGPVWKGSELCICLQCDSCDVIGSNQWRKTPSCVQNFWT